MKTKEMNDLVKQLPFNQLLELRRKVNIEVNVRDKKRFEVEE